MEQNKIEFDHMASPWWTGLLAAATVGSAIRRLDSFGVIKAFNCAAKGQD